MTHVEVSRIQTHADKINSQLEIVLSEKPQIYSKTKEKYKDLAVSLLSSVEKISNILEVNSLANLDNQDSEFHTSSVDVSDLTAAVQRASAKIDSYASFVAPNVSQIEANANKETIRRYGVVLENATNVSFTCLEASECCYILNKWFKARFSNNSRSSSFKYNIAYLPEWITNIIILYGKYHSLSDTPSFMNMMSEWCDNLDTENTKWAVPYEVHQLSKICDPSSFTMDAVLIGDIIMDEALYNLTETHSPDIVANLDCYPVASKVKLKNASLLPAIRTRLAKRDSLIAEYNLTISERRKDCEPNLFKN